MYSTKEGYKAYPHHLTDRLEPIIKQGPPKGKKSKKSENLIKSIGEDIDRKYSTYRKIIIKRLNDR